LLGLKIYSSELNGIIVNIEKVLEYHYIEQDLAYESIYLIDFIFTHKTSEDNMINSQQTAYLYINLNQI